MSQLRLNPLTGRWVTIVGERALRPSDFAPRTPTVDADPSRPCPFCPGHEESTPPALETFNAAGAWQLRVVPNLYPAFSGDEHLAVRNLGPVHVMAEASGIHEVLVLTPEHDGRIEHFDDAHMDAVMLALRHRLDQHAQAANIRYTQVIVNHGREAGASLSHPHGQLLGLPFVPGEIIDEERAFARFDGGCILCTTVEAEIATGQRVVLATDDALVVCPYWSASPYELLVIPRSHARHLPNADDAALFGVGRAIRDALGRLDRTLGDAAYNMVFHTAPHHHQGAYHWHVHLWPKLATVAGFEKGTGVYINVVPPEVAAASLREVAVDA